MNDAETVVPSRETLDALIAMFRSPAGGGRWPHSARFVEAAEADLARAEQPEPALKVRAGYICPQCGKGDWTLCDWEGETEVRRCSRYMVSWWTWSHAEEPGPEQPPSCGQGGGDPNEDRATARADATSGSLEDAGSGEPEAFQFSESAWLHPASPEGDWYMLLLKPLPKAPFGLLSTRRLEKLIEFAPTRVKERIAKAAACTSAEQPPPGGQEGRRTQDAP